MSQAEPETIASLNRAIALHPDDAKTIARRGETYRLMGCYEEALADFNRAIALKPDYAWAIAHRGETYYLMKRYDEALADFNRAVELKPDNFWAIAHRGASYHRLKRYDEALSDLSKAIALKPDYPWAHFYRGQVYSLMHCYEEALSDCDCAIALDKTIIPCWPGERGLLLSYLGRYAEAIECCERGLQENPDDYITRYTLAVVKARWIGLAEAQAEINKTRALLQAAVNNDSGRAGVLYRLGGLAAVEGNFDEALNDLAEAILLENEPLELARRDLAWIDLHNEPRFQSLIAETSIKDKPKNAKAIAQKGESYCLKKQYQEALECFSQAIALNPNYAWAIARRGETYRLMNRYLEALTDFNRAIELKLDYVWAIAHRGQTYSLMHRYSEALADFNRAVELKPDYAWAYACRCQSYEHIKCYEEALADLDKTVALDETVCRYWRADRGLLLSMCGRHAEAIEYCEQALMETPGDLLIPYSLAVAKACWHGRASVRAEIDKARVALQSIVKTDPEGDVLCRLGGLAALEGKIDQALHYLQEAIIVRGRPIETPHHDPAWVEVRADPRFQSLMSGTTEA